MSNAQTFARPAMILPRDRSPTEAFFIDKDGADFITIDLANLEELAEYMGSRSVRFGYVWFGGIRFIVMSSRLDAKHWDKRVTLSYGPIISKGPVTYGPVIILGCERNETVRSLSDTEKDVLWSNLRIVAVNRKTKEDPDIQLALRLCFAEDEPEKSVPFEVETPDP